jgi:thiol:disulfide interchange protein DsbD
MRIFKHHILTQNSGALLLDRFKRAIGSAEPRCQLPDRPILPRLHQLSYEVARGLWGILLIMLTVWGKPAQGQVAGLGFGAPNVVTATLKAVPAVIHAPGTAELRLSVTVIPGYHLQSHHPLDKFLVPADATISPTPGISFGKARYPEAKLIPASAQITSIGKLAVYEGHFIITVPCRILANAPNGAAGIHAALTFQACNAQSCLPPQTLKLTTTLQIKNTTSAAAGPISGSTAPTAGNSSTAIAPLSHSQNSSAVEALQEIKSLHYHVKSTHAPLWQLILFALLGGMILNVMPCVLPVIPLKVLAMVQQAHGSRKMAVVHALVFSAGIVSLFLILAIVMGIYRATTGQALTYGMQYQHPAFLIATALIVLALALSMLGVWTIQAPRAVYAVENTHGGLAGAFGMGLLATLLATPCSAPFLGVMLTWALVQPTAVIVLFFSLIGIGMAWPYVLLAAFPAWLSKIPRAGRWSEIVKEALGLVMVAVAVYLLLSTENRGQIAAGFVLAVILAIVCWGWGRLPDVNMPAGRIWGIRLGFLAGGVLAGALYLMYSGGLDGYVTDAANANSMNVDTAARGSFRVNHWQNFDLAGMNAALRSGHPVVVDFTAPWCINCRFVKATVLDSQAVRHAFGQARAVLLSADIDQRISKALWIKLGGRAIPYLAILSPRHPLSPAILRDIYTQTDVIDDVHAAEP